jgi:hypothetical protein
LIKHCVAAALQRHQAVTAAAAAAAGAVVHMAQQLVQAV